MMMMMMRGDDDHDHDDDDDDDVIIIMMMMMTIMRCAEHAQESNVTLILSEAALNDGDVVGYDT